MKLGLYYRCIVADKNGKVVKRTHWKKSRSFVLQFLQHIELLSFHAHNAYPAPISMKDIGGVARTVYTSTYPSTALYFAMNAPDNNGSYGLVVGTGTAAPTNADYALATIIGHGTGAGQLDYGAHSRTTTGIVGANVDYIISRTYYNGSGASITVNEIGVYCCSQDSGNNTCCFCIVRDVITAITVANTQTLTVQYTLRTTV